STSAPVTQHRQSRITQLQQLYLIHTQRLVAAGLVGRGVVHQGKRNVCWFATNPERFK
ncbi:hypothetical protein OS493_026559, partial [Desmophyllum pertusum]